MDKDDFFNSVKDELLFKVRAFTSQGGNREILRIKTKGDRYLLSAYTRKEELIENNFLIKKCLSMNTQIFYQGGNTYERNQRTIILCKGIC